MEAFKKVRLGKGREDPAGDLQSGSSGVSEIKLGSQILVVFYEEGTYGSVVAQ